MSEPITIDPVLYWKLRAYMQTHQLLMERCQRQVSESQLVLGQQMAACGLDPKLNYHLTDDGCSAVLADATATAHGVAGR